MSWLGDDEKLRPIDNSVLLCEHDKVNPEKFREYKVISSKVVMLWYLLIFVNYRTKSNSFEKADELFGEYLGGPRLQCSALCLDCVKTKCITSQLRSQLDADSKVVTNLMKTKIEA